MPDPSTALPTSALPSDPDGEEWALSGSRLGVATAAVFLFALLLLACLYSTSPLIYDADSYYHLAVARGYAEDGFSAGLKWVRFGLLADQFGDKEFLFHVLLMPFTTLMEPTLGGRVCLALLGASLLTLIGWLSMRAIGLWGALVPFWLLIGSMEFFWRLVRLRPELVSLCLVLCALWAAVGRRYLLLAILAAIYALSYTAVHAFVGLFLLMLLAGAGAAGRWEPRVFVYPLVGAGVGLVVHPHFPDNLVVWWFQTVEYFRFKQVLDVGTEIQPMRLDLAALTNLGWIVGLLLLRRVMTPGSDSRSGRASLAFGVAAAAFAVLYVMMSRFALYSVPLITLWWLFEMRRRGMVWTSPVRWRGGRGIAAPWVWVVILIVSLPVAVYELGRYRGRNSPGPAGERLTDRQQVSAVLPADAHVVATWRSTPIHMFWTPQGRYINVLDPVFLAAADPAVHRTQDDIFSGREPDVPGRATGDLDSEFIVLSLASEPPLLMRRLLGDPRAELLHRGINAVFRFREPVAEVFLRDWQIVPSGTTLPVVEDAIEGWVRLSARSQDSRLGGYVDAGVGERADECLALVHVGSSDGAGVRNLELAPVGPTILWLDDQEVVRVQGALGGVLGEGVLLRAEVAAGEHRLTALTCPEPETGRRGFYLVDRGEP